MSTLVLDRPALKTVLLDALLCVAVVAVPALSHAAALPLYRFEPMRLLLFAAILCSNRRNALAMALCLPLLSTLTSGHPVFPKVVLIQGELALNALVFCALVRRSHRFVLAAAVSVLAAKAVYYAAKFVLIEAALLDGDLVATPWTCQFAVLGIVLVGGGVVRRARGTGRV
ncbi:hypothetical protein KKA85_12975 [bacterium]|nr:hypothetical protein [bacterium]MBU1676678.1 hypothetical protein [bacterium]